MCRSFFSSTTNLHRPRWPKTCTWRPPSSASRGSWPRRRWTSFRSLPSQTPNEDWQQVKGSLVRILVTKDEVAGDGEHACRCKCCGNRCEEPSDYDGYNAFKRRNGGRIIDDPQDTIPAVESQWEANNARNNGVSCWYIKAIFWSPALPEASSHQCPHHTISVGKWLILELLYVCYASCYCWCRYTTEDHCTKELEDCSNQDGLIERQSARAYRGTEGIGDIIRASAPSCILIVVLNSW